MTIPADLAEVNARWCLLNETYRNLQDDLHYYEHIGNNEAADDVWRVMQELAFDMSELETLLVDFAQNNP